MDLFEQGPKIIIDGNYGMVEYIEDFLPVSIADTFLKQ